MNEFAQRSLLEPLGPTFECDARFDAHLPNRARERADQYWTPVAVARRAARLFRERGVTTVLDVGCGPGKFCIVAGRTEPGLLLDGVEQRSLLVRSATRLAARLGVTNVRFSLADAVEIAWDAYQGFYFFNPFAENVLSKRAQFDGAVELSRQRFAADLIHIEQLLATTRVGTVVVTYHGLGGPIPSCFDPVHAEQAGTDVLRVWVKRQRQTEGWSWLDSSQDLTRATRAEIYGALATFVG